jgi:hypothetical protein
MPAIREALTGLNPGAGAIRKVSCAFIVFVITKTVGMDAMRGVCPIQKFHEHRVPDFGANDGP